MKIPCAVWHFTFDGVSLKKKTAFILFFFIGYVHLGVVTSYLK